ncbi:MAG: hypothetical protein MJZ82_04420 [Paludibacteraceae bacterium]|nr:hypothetical protein [Paludibacteraceae bacterium]
MKTFKFILLACVALSFNACFLIEPEPEKPTSELKFLTCEQLAVLTQYGMDEIVDSLRIWGWTVTEQNKYSDVAFDINADSKKKEQIVLYREEDGVELHYFAFFEDSRLKQETQDLQDWVKYVGLEFDNEFGDGLFEEGDVSYGSSESRHQDFEGMNYEDFITALSQIPGHAYYSVDAYWSVSPYGLTPFKTLNCSMRHVPTEQGDDYPAVYISVL